MNGSHACPAADGRPLGIAMGDPAGIGPELVARLYADRTPRRAVVYGDRRILERAIARIGCSLTVREIITPDEAEPAADRLDLVPLSRLPADLAQDGDSALAGRAAFSYLDVAADDLREGALSALVTAPIAARSFRAAGLRFAGLGDLLAHYCGRAPFGTVAMCHRVRLLPACLHRGPGPDGALITVEGEIRAIGLADQVCRAAGIARPRIAIAGPGPDRPADAAAAIAPAIRQAQASGIDATGPWPDAVACRRARGGDFDIVVAHGCDRDLGHGITVTVCLTEAAPGLRAALACASALSHAQGGGCRTQ